MRKLSSLILINAAVFIALIFVVELSARLFVDSYHDHIEFRLTQPAPYKEAPYFSEEFIHESFLQPGGWIAPPGTGLVFPKDFKGKFFTVEHGIRHTSDIPNSATKTIYLFGGSTVYNSEVPDRYTIASYLQRKLISGGHDQYRVLNFGVTSVSTNQQLERLKITKLSKDDIVIFFDGVNDVVQGVLYGNSSNTIYGNDKTRPRWQKILSKLSNHSVLVRKLLTSMNANYKIMNLNNRVQDTVARYRDNIELAERETHKQGGIFIHILQPNIYSLSPRNNYERDLLTQGFIPAQAEEAFNATYPHFQEIVRNRQQRGLRDFDFTKAFNGLEKPVFLDFCHINHVGNEIIANNIFSILLTSNSIQ